MSKIDEQVVPTSEVLTFDQYQKEAHVTAQYPNIMIVKEADSTVGCDEELDTVQQITSSPMQKLVAKPVLFLYAALGLAGETGEVVEKIKKIVRNKGGSIDDEDREAIRKELGDVAWYLAELCTQFSLSFGDVADHNLLKLHDRMERDIIKSQGDNR